MRDQTRISLMQSSLKCRDRDRDHDDHGRRGHDGGGDDDDRLVRDGGDDRDDDAPFELLFYALHGGGGDDGDAPSLGHDQALVFQLFRLHSTPTYLPYLPQHSLLGVFSSLLA